MSLSTDPLFIIIDLFCGFGGTTTGFEQAMYVNAKGELCKVSKVIACVNHDPKAIKSHWLNHPDVAHFEEDIRTLDLTELIKVVNHWRKIYPNAKVKLHASLECTNFSKAKGGQSRDADSRTLAEHLYRYILAINPDYITIENVVEFMSWGPLISKELKTDEGYKYCPIQIIPTWEDDKGKIQNGWQVIWQGIPESKKNGQDFVKWKNQICSYGYYDEWKEMNSADYGAYTSRNRLFGCFAKEGLPIVWPEPTHSKKASEGMFGNIKKWKPVKEVLNFEDEGESIFNRKKPLSDKTLERIYAGLIKYIAKGDTSFIAKYFSGRPKGKVISTNSPAGTLTTKDGQSLVQPLFLSNYKSGNPNSKNTSIESPSGTLTTIPTQSLVQAEFLLKYNSINGKTGVHHPPSINEPAPTVTCQGRLGLVQPEFLDHYYGNGFNTSMEQPCPTLRTKDGAALVQPKFFIDRDFKSPTHSSIDEPAGTITTVPKMNLVEASTFIVNPSHGGHSTSTDAPCPVIIARQDKAPLYLVQAENGNVSIAVFDCDTEIMIKIKQFMAAFGLVDIKMRMLRVAELLKIQGFPEGYKMVGNQTDHKKFIGNSVHPLVPKAWSEEFARKFLELESKAA